MDGTNIINYIVYIDIVTYHTVHSVGGPFDYRRFDPDVLAMVVLATDILATDVLATDVLTTNVLATDVLDLLYTATVNYLN